MGGFGSDTAAMYEVLAGGDLGVADEVLVPDTRTSPSAAATFVGAKATVAAMSSGLRRNQFDDEEMVTGGGGCAASQKASR